MPGPSFSWSSFSNSVEDASSRIQLGALSATTSQVLPMVLERLDESLVLMCEYLGWDLADAGTLIANKILKLPLFFFVYSVVFSVCYAKEASLIPSEG